MVILFDLNGLGARMRSFAHLEDSIRTIPLLTRVVCILMQIACRGNALHSAIANEFDFGTCHSAEETEKLKLAYHWLFAEEQLDPSDIHTAAVEGKLFEKITLFFHGFAEATLSRMLLEDEGLSPATNERLYAML